VVQISQRNFNVEMDSYLSRRKKDLPQKEEIKVVDEPMEEQEEKQPAERRNIFQKFLDFVAGESIQPVEDEELDEEEFEERPRPTIFGRLSGWMSKDEEPPSQPVVSDDLVEALKIQNKWLAKLPGDKIREFKASEDYKKYKEILKKYNLIKS